MRAFPPSSAPSRRARGARRQGSRVLTTGVLGALSLASAGCAVKGGDNPNLIQGKQVFVARCGSCHTLARANTKGTVGPNLDESFRASVAEGLRRNAIRGVVENQIKIPNPEGAMPANLARGATARNISAYVEYAAARPGQDAGLLATAVEAPGAGKAAVEKNGKLSIPASPSGQLAFVTNKASGTTGPVTVEMPNTSGVSHNIAIETGEGGAAPKGAKLGASPFTTKTTASFNVTLKPGAYTFFCEAPGHRAAGMYGTLTVK